MLIFESSLSHSFLLWAQIFSITQWTVNFNTIPYLSKVCLRITNLELFFKIDQDQLKVALTM